MAEICQIFVVFLENLRYQKDILKLTDLYLFKGTQIEIPEELSHILFCFLKTQLNKRQSDDFAFQRTITFVENKVSSTIETRINLGYKDSRVNM